MTSTIRIGSTAVRMILPIIVLGSVGAMGPADAADRIFANGFEPCCTLGGEVDGLTGNGFVVHLVAGAISESKPITANGGPVRLYTFSNTVPPGTAYAVTISTQPSGQTCTLSNATGTMPNIPVVDIDATCVAGPADLVWDDGNWNDADWQ